VLEHVASQLKSTSLQKLETRISQYIEKHPYDVAVYPLLLSREPSNYANFRKRQFMREPVHAKISIEEL